MLIDNTLMIVLSLLVLAPYPVVVFALLHSALISQIKKK